MSQGNLDVNRTYSTLVTYDTDCIGGTATTTIDNLGFRYKRTWAGGNSPTVTTPKTFKLFKYNVYDHRGRRIGTRTRKVYDRPQKRDRKLTENPYLTSWERSENVLLNINHPGVCEGKVMKGFGSSYDYLQTASWLSWTANDELDLISKLRSSIQGSGFNLAVFLGEGKESLKTIANAATRISNSLRHLRKGRFKAAGRALGVDRPGRDISPKEVTEKWFASNWLQYIYGWRPLLQDIKGAAEHLAALQNRPCTLTFKAGKRKKGGPPDNNPSFRVSGDGMRAATIVARLTHINEAALIGLTDPMSLAWEKLPYSFIADWILPVGDYLDASALSKSLTGTYTLSRIEKYKVSGIVSKYRFNDILVPGNPYREWGTVSREILSELNVPLPEFKGREQIASWTHATSSIALLIQAIPRFGNR